MRKKGGTKPALLSSRLDRSRTHTRQGPAAAQTETPANFPAGISAYGVIVGNAPGRSFENKPRRAVMCFRTSGSENRSCR
jgi:hypothetical protein